MMDHPELIRSPSLARTRFGSVKSFFAKSMSDSTLLEPAAKELALPEYAGGTETVLFVEDMEPLQQVIAASLEHLGYKVLSAASGEEALALAASHQDAIDLLLTDVMMPHMKGTELAQKLAGKRPHMKVIYVSGYPRAVLAPYGVLESGTVLLHKPFSIKILAAKLREVLDG